MFDFQLGNSVLHGTGQRIPTVSYTHLELRIAVPKVRAAGTIVYVALDGVYAGYIVIGDTLKKEVRETMDILKRRYHKELVMLTGDNEIVGGAVGKLLNMDHIYTNLLPAEKVEKVEEFIEDVYKRQEVFQCSDIRLELLSGLFLLAAVFSFSIEVIQ